MGESDGTGGRKINALTPLPAPVGPGGLLTICWEPFWRSRESIDVPGTFFLFELCKDAVSRISSSSHVKIIIMKSLSLIVTAAMPLLLSIACNNQRTFKNK